MFTTLAIALGITGLVAGLAGSIISSTSSAANIQSQDAYQISQTTAEEATAKQKAAESQVALGNEQISAKSSADTSLEQGMQQSYLQQVANESQYMDLAQQGAQSKGALAAKTTLGGIQQGTTLQQVTDSNIRDSLAAKKEANNAYRDSSISNVIATQQQFSAGSAYKNMYSSKSDAISADLNDTLSSLESQKSYLQDQYDSYTTEWWNPFGSNWNKWANTYGGGVLGSLGSAASTVSKWV
jgi:hypothetical protein